MDIENMHIAVKLELDKTSALELPAFEPEEIDFWLNNAIRKFVKTRYSGVNVKRESFEQTQKRIDDLRTLVKYASIASSYSGNIDSTYGTVFTLPTTSGSEYWFALQEDCLISIPGYGTRKVGITECTLDEFRQKRDDPFSEHVLHYNNAKPLRLYSMSGSVSQVELIDDGNYDITHYYLTYLRKPVEVDIDADSPVDCDLPEHTHDEIVKLAVSMMLENIEQPRYQTYQNEVFSVE